MKQANQERLALISSERFADAQYIKFVLEGYEKLRTNMRKQYTSPEMRGIDEQIVEKRIELAAAYLAASMAARDNGEGAVALELAYLYAEQEHLAKVMREKLDAAALRAGLYGAVLCDRYLPDLESPGAGII